MFMGFENARKRASFTARMFAFILATYSLIIKRQNKELRTAKADERERIAKLIEDGVPHKSSTCNNGCDAHIIVQFIRELKD